MKVIQRLMFQVLPNCREAERLQSRRLDERISAYRRGLLWMHCLMCSCCRRFGIQLKFIRNLCGQMPENCDHFEVEFGMPEEIRERLRQKIAGETGPKPGRGQSA